MWWEKPEWLLSVPPGGGPKGHPFSKQMPDEKTGPSI